MKNFKFTLFVLFSTILVFIGCSDDEVFKNTDSVSNMETKNNSLTMRLNENDKPDEHMQIVLGKKLENPYTVKNMQNAFDYYNSVILDSPFKGKKVEATHYYIKINPNTEEQLEMLDDLDNSDDENAPVLHDYPLDYEILEEGDYYIYPRDENDIYHSAYTLIPIDYRFTENVPYEILDEIYEPSEEEYDIETVALFFAGWKEDLEADEIFVDEKTLDDYLRNSFVEEVVDEENTNNQSGARLFGKRYRPNGYVRVQNTETNVMNPLQKAKISIGRNIFWRYTYTDDNGYFSSPKKYRGKVRIRAKWRGNTATIRKTWNEVLGLWVSDHLMTIKRSSNGRTKNIIHSEPHTGIFGIDLAGGHLWFKGTVHNGLRKYVDFSNSNGISHTISSANVWAWAKGKNASAPMLYKYRQLPQMSTVANVGQANFWSVLTNIISGNVISLVPSHLRPDLIFAGLNNKKVSYDNRSNTIRIHQTVFHESGHYSHASKAGSWFWAQVFGSEISNQILEGDPYVDGSKPSFTAGKRIALAEGWGNFCEFKITSAIYGKAYMTPNGFSTGMYSTSNINTYMERFNVYDVPMTADDFDNHNWFAHGVIWDALDNSVDNPTLSRRWNGNGTTVINSIVDNCYLGLSNSNNLSPIFNRLSGNVESPTQLKNALKSAYPSKQAQIEELFTSYGY